MSYDIVLNDTGPQMVINITADGSAFVLNAGTDTAVLRYITPAGDTEEVSLTISNAAIGELTRAWQSGDLPVVGAYKGQVQVTRSGDTTFPRTFPNNGSRLIWWVHVEI